MTFDSTLKNKVEIQYQNATLPILKTSRLILKEIQVEDITKEYIDWLNCPKINQNLEIRFQHQTLESVTEFIRNKLNDTLSSQHFGIFVKSNNVLVGNVTLNNINNIHKFADISFVIGHPIAQGKGFATEAVHAVTHYAFQNNYLYKLWAGYYDGHTASANVLRKNGYQLEGRIKEKFIDIHGNRVDHIIVGITAKEYSFMTKAKVL